MMTLVHALHTSRRYIPRQMSSFTCPYMTMQTLVLVCLTLALGSVCGRVIVDNHVFGGVEAKVGAWPWVVSIQEDGEHICGGTLIKPTFVLTSARCIEQAAIGDMTVVLGLHDSLQPAEGLTEAITVGEIIPYTSLITKVRSQYIADTDEEFVDLALIKMKREASNNKYISNATLADKGSDFAGRKCIIAGWGPTVTDPGLSTALHQATLRVWSDRECGDLFPLKRENQICAEGANGEVACRGDSGGPLMCLDNSQEKESVHLVVGVSITQNCRQLQNPSVFQFVPGFRDWIENNSQ